MTARAAVCDRINEHGQAAEQSFANTQVGLIRAWCREHVGRALEVTAQKDFCMAFLYDDRAIQVETNTGRMMPEAVERLLAAQVNAVLFPGHCIPEMAWNKLVACVGALARQAEAGVALARYVEGVLFKNSHIDTELRVCEDLGELAAAVHKGFNMPPNLITDIAVGPEDNPQFLTVGQSGFFVTEPGFFRAAPVQLAMYTAGGQEWVIAYSPADAHAIWTGIVGADGGEVEDWTPTDPEMPFSFRDEHGRDTTLPVREWVAQHGRGHFASADF